MTFCTAIQPWLPGGRRLLGRGNIAYVGCNIRQVRRRNALSAPKPPKIASKGTRVDGCPISQAITPMIAAQIKNHAPSASSRCVLGDIRAVGLKRANKKMVHAFPPVRRSWRFTAPLMYRQSMTKSRPSACVESPSGPDTCATSPCMSVRRGCSSRRNCASWAWRNPAHALFHRARNIALGRRSDSPSPRDVHRRRSRAHVLLTTLPGTPGS